MYYYALTLRKNSKPTLQDYEEHMNTVQTKYKHLKIVYHYEGTGGIHLHGLVSSPRKVMIKAMHPGKGWKLFFDPVRDTKAWEAYMTKDVHLEPALLKAEADKLHLAEEQRPGLSVAPRTSKSLTTCVKISSTPAGLVPLHSNDFHKWEAETIARINKINLFKIKA